MSGFHTVVYTGTRPPTEATFDRLECVRIPMRDIEAVKVEGGTLEIVHLPMLEVRSLEIDPRELREALAEPAAVVLYSKNAVRALQSFGVGDTLAARDDLQWWTVGSKTADFLHARLGVEAHIPEEERFEGLKRAVESADLPERLVSLSLKGKTRDLSPVLDSDEAEWVDFPVYETVPTPYDDLPERLAALEPDWLAATSSRGARLLADHLDALSEMALLDDLRFAAIGPKTAATLEELGYPVDAIPDSPGVEAIFEAIEVED